MQPRNMIIDIVLDDADYAGLTAAQMSYHSLLAVDHTKS